MLYLFIYLFIFDGKIRIIFLTRLTYRKCGNMFLVHLYRIRIYLPFILIFDNIV